MPPLRDLLGPLAIAAVAIGCSSTEAAPPIPMIDASDEAVVTPEAGPAEAGAPNPIGCAPGNVTSYMPQFKPPRPHAPACAADQISGYFDACLDTKSNIFTCNTFKRTNTACVACVESSESDPAWGPITWFDSRLFYYLNNPGCLVLATSAPPTVACAHAAQALRGCEVAACETNCEEDLEAESVHHFALCEEASKTGVCATYVAAVKTGCNDIDNDALSTCYGTSGETDADYFAGVIDLFCGGAPSSDAGSDG